MDFGFANLKKMDFRSENLEKTSILVREFRKKKRFWVRKFEQKSRFWVRNFVAKNGFCVRKFRKKNSTKISIFDQNFDFRPKFRFSTKIYILDHICHFWHFFNPTIHFGSKFCFFCYNFYFYQDFEVLVKNPKFCSKIYFFVKYSKIIPS